MIVVLSAMEYPSEQSSAFLALNPRLITCNLALFQLLLRAVKNHHEEGEARKAGDPHECAGQGIRQEDGGTAGPSRWPLARQLARTPDRNRSSASGREEVSPNE